jgi:hypothetical protein
VRTTGRLAVLALLVLPSFSPAAADEGMWLPQQVPALAERLAALGFEGDARAFADLTGQPMGAIVSLGGCSASFVSPEGLVVTNHHCVTGALQYNATPERNLLKDGYRARGRGEELPAGPGSRLYVTIRATDVTSDLERLTTPDLSDRARHDVVDRWVKKRTAECEKGGSRCRVASFFGGVQWIEIEQLEIQDVRLVYAPPEGIGNFGGEVDNWKWPRHVGDFSFYRAYVRPDGRPAPFSRDNVPYRPKRWLTVSPKGAGPGDLVFVVGYPGYTQRHRTYGDIAELVAWDLPRSIRRADEQIAIADALAAGGTEIEIKVRPKRRGLANGFKKNRGVLEALTRDGVLGLKKDREAALQAWIAATPERRREFGDVVPALEAMREADRRTRERDAVYGALVGGRGSVLGAAHTLYQLARNRPKKDVDREPEYQERNWTRIAESLERLQRDLDPAVDRAFLRYALVEAAALPAGMRIEAVDRAAGLAPGMAADASGKAIDAFLDRLYAGTKLFDQAYRLALRTRSAAELLATGDSFLALAAALDPLGQEILETGKARQGARYRLVPRYMKALLAQTGGLVAPDANGTLRVTYGRVQGVDGPDGIFFKPQTTVSGIPEKDRGEGEFEAPQRLLAAVRSQRGGKASPWADPALGEVPVDFLSTVDTTGGNSGSATLNARGELCGLLFDGMYETVVSDIVHDPVRTRSIHVDSRYLLWVLSEVEGAEPLIQEMGLAP